MKLNKSKEDYLEAVLILKNTNKCVRSIDVANYLNFSRASVSIAMKKLREDGYILFDDDGVISLTKEGREIAINTLEKHKFITNWLKEIGVSDEEAENTACLVEHSISDGSF